jgi:hypothetical protein
MTVVSCECGARVRLPEGGEAGPLRCPKCKRTIRTGARRAEPDDELTSGDVPAEERRAIRDYLDEGEAVVWVGRPSGRVHRHANLLRYLFLGCFGGVGLALVAMGLLAPLPGLGRLAFAGAGAVFALVALLILLVALRRPGGRPDLYLLTVRRLVVWREPGKAASFMPADLKSLRRRVISAKKDYGSLIFGYGNRDGLPPVFDDLEEVSKVEELVRATLVDRGRR